MEFHIVEEMVLFALLTERKEAVERKKKESGRTEWSALMFQEPAGTRGIHTGCHAFQSQTFTKSLALFQNLIGLLRENRKRSPINDTVEQGVQHLEIPTINYFQIGA